jgi:DNA-binding GntR family transcriptional regulator
VVTSNTRPPRAWAVADSIRQDILAGHLEPGSRLAFSELSAQHSVSVGVLREALIRLVDGGIVRAQSNIGFTVMSLSSANLEDLTTVRSLTEPRFARQAVLGGSVTWESGLVAAHHLLVRTPYFEDASEHRSQAWLAAHAQFHLALVAGANSFRMQEIVGRLRDEADLYRRWYVQEEDVRITAAGTAEEHRMIADAATDRDADRVERLLRQHIVRSAERLHPPQSENDAPAARKARRQPSQTR